MPKTIANIREFLRERIPTLKLVESLEGESGLDVKFIAPKGKEQTHELIQQYQAFMLDLMAEVGVEFYIMKPYNILLVRNSGKVGRPKGYSPFGTAQYTPPLKLVPVKSDLEQSDPEQELLDLIVSSDEGSSEQPPAEEPEGYVAGTYRCKACGYSGSVEKEGNELCCPACGIVGNNMLAKVKA